MEEEIEMLSRADGLVNTGSGEDRLVNTGRLKYSLVKDICKLLGELGQEGMAEELVELVGSLDRWIQTRDIEIEELMSALDELQDELGEELDRVDFLEKELDRVRELEGTLMESNWVLREVLFDEEGNLIALREHTKSTETIKIAINTIYGGFDLSEAAELRYKDLTGNYINIYNISRDDKVLIQVIEELGRSASAEYSRIRIVEVPLGTNWNILDYDGLEMVIDTDRVWRGHE